MLLIRQDEIEQKLNIISKILVGKIDSERGFSEKSAMIGLGIKDRRTLRFHASRINHKGDRYFWRKI